MKKRQKNNVLQKHISDTKVTIETKRFYIFFSSIDICLQRFFSDEKTHLLTSKSVQKSHESVSERPEMSSPMSSDVSSGDEGYEEGYFSLYDCCSEDYQHSLHLDQHLNLAHMKIQSYSSP